jgi:predicted DNA-binding ribbon-helix-helix protein
MLLTVGEKRAMSVRLEPDVYERVQKIAKARRWSFNTALNWVLERSLGVDQSNSGNSGKGASGDNERSDGK